MSGIHPPHIMKWRGWRITAWFWLCRILLFQAQIPFYWAGTSLWSLFSAYCSSSLFHWTGVQGRSLEIRIRLECQPYLVLAKTMQTYQTATADTYLTPRWKALPPSFPVFVSFGLLYEYILLADGCPISAIKTPPIIQQKESAYIAPYVKIIFMFSTFL